MLTGINVATLTERDAITLVRTRLAPGTFYNDYHPMRSQSLSSQCPKTKAELSLSRSPIRPLNDESFSFCRTPRALTPERLVLILRSRHYITHLPYALSNVCIAIVFASSGLGRNLAASRRLLNSEGEAFDDTKSCRPTAMRS